MYYCYDYDNLVSMNGFPGCSFNSFQFVKEKKTHFKALNSKVPRTCLKQVKREIHMTLCFRILLRTSFPHDKKGFLFLCFLKQLFSTELKRFREEFVQKSNSVSSVSLQLLGWY